MDFSRVITYEDMDGVECETREKFHSVEEFELHCKNYNIKYHTFRDLKLKEEYDV